MPREYGGFSGETEKDYKNLNYYEILGVTQGASFGQVKEAYHKKITQAHTDVGGDLEYAQYLGEAYNTLKNKDLRSKYDVKIGYKKSKSTKNSSQPNTDYQKSQPKTDYSPPNTEPDGSYSSENSEKEDVSAHKERAEASKERWAEKAQSSQERWESRKTS